MKNGPGRPARPAKELPPAGKIMRAMRGDMSVHEAGAKVGKAHTWWHARETGERHLTDDDMQAIAKAFRVTWTIGARSIAAE